MNKFTTAVNQQLNEFPVWSTKPGGVGDVAGELGRKSQDPDQPRDSKGRGEHEETLRKLADYGGRKGEDPSRPKHKSKTVTPQVMQRINDVAEAINQKVVELGQHPGSPAMVADEFIDIGVTHGGLEKTFAKFFVRVVVTGVLIDQGALETDTLKFRTSSGKIKREKKVVGHKEVLQQPELQQDMRDKIEDVLTHPDAQVEDEPEPEPEDDSSAWEKLKKGMGIGGGY